MKYEKPELEVMLLDDTDVITTSDTDVEDDLIIDDIGGNSGLNGGSGS